MNRPLLQAKPGVLPFALAITALNLLGHFWLGFEQAWAAPVVALAAAYSSELITELTINGWTAARFRGGVPQLIRFLLPAHITGLAVAMLMYTNERFVVLAFAASVAIFSKVLFRVPVSGGAPGATVHFLNPSNFGIAVTLLVFSDWVGVAQPYQFTENVSGPLDWILPLIIVCSGSFLNFRATKRIVLVIAWLVGFAGQAMVRALLSEQNVLTLLAPMTGMAFVLFSFYMVSDPMTTPRSTRGQIGFGIFTAGVYGILSHSGVVFGLFFSLCTSCAIRGIFLYLVALVPEGGSRRYRLFVVGRAIKLFGLMATAATSMVAIGGLFFLFRRREMAWLYMGKIAAFFFELMGPAAIKIGQVASCRGDIFPSTFLFPLQRLRSDVRHQARIDLERELANSYDCPITEVFAALEMEPIGAGSIALVYRATLVTGENVAVKVLRRDIRRLIQTDLAILRLMLKTMAALPRFRGIPLLESFDVFSKVVADQCNMLIESENARKILRMVGRESAIPVPIFSLCRESVLVMQYLSHKSPLPIHEPMSRAVRAAARSLLRDVYRMIFVHGVVHGDLHPGNVALSNDDRIIFYDFGLVAVMTRTERQVFRRFFLAVAAGDSVVAADCIATSAIRIPKGFVQRQLIEALHPVVDEAHGKPTCQFSVVLFVQKLFLIQRSLGIYGSPGFVNAIWALAMFEGLVRNSYPDLDFQLEARLFFRLAKTDLGPRYG